MWDIALAQVLAEFAGQMNIGAEIYALGALLYAKLMIHARVAKRPFFAQDRHRSTPPERF
jgi:hypothetical protein